MKIRAPMASLYVLGNPDHYTEHKFIPFYWRGYVKEVLSAWDKVQATENVSDLDSLTNKVVINKNQGWFIGLSKVSDYVYCPSAYEDKSLYNWIQRYKKS